MFVSIYGVFQKRFVDLSTCRICEFVFCRMSLLLRLRYVTPTGSVEQTEKYSKNFESIFLLIQKYLEINTNCFGISLYFHYLCINI